MAIGAPQDPVQAVHQLLSLLEYAELDRSDRDVLERQREALQRVRAQPTPAAWLQWYREVLQATRQLQTRWQQARDPAAASANPGVALAPTSAARLKETYNVFIQRWNVRLQDQALLVKNQAAAAAHVVPVSDVMSKTHIQFIVRPDELGAFATMIRQMLNDWGVDVASKLTPSWHDHLKEVVTAERTPRVTLRPPPWPTVQFGLSALPPPQIEAYAVRRPTALMSIQRSFRTVQSIVTMLVGLTVPVVAFGLDFASSRSGEASGSSLRTAFTAIAAVLGLGVFLPLSAWFGFASLQDEVAQSRTDQTQRIRGALLLWASQAVDSQRARIQSILAASASEAKLRLAEWVDRAWDATPPSIAASKSPSKGPDYGQLLVSMNSIRAALATRVAQLNFELAAPSASQVKPTP